MPMAPTNGGSTSGTSSNPRQQSSAAEIRIAADKIASGIDIASVKPVTITATSVALTNPRTSIGSPAMSTT